VAAATASDRAWVRLTARLTTMLAIFGALVPGVFVGASIARMGLDEGVGSVMAAAARTAFVGALAGLIIARTEGADERAARRLDGAGDAWGWLRANRWRALRLSGGVWLGAWVLGLHEIEASVMVRPPGRGNLPQHLLSDLHYARLESLSAGGVVLGVLGVLVGLLAGLVLGLGQRITRNGNPGGTRQ
jgi:ABC-type spermidine/putrescine transport system permease subunit II